MKNILLKNTTSHIKKRKVLSTRETFEKNGVKTIIRRHFIYKAIEVKEFSEVGSSPNVFMKRISDKDDNLEKFFCRLKNRIYTSLYGRKFLILFVHSLCIVSRPSVSTFS